MSHFKCKWQLNPEQKQRVRDLLRMGSFRVFSNCQLLAVPVETIQSRERSPDSAAEYSEAEKVLREDLVFNSFGMLLCLLT